MEHQENFETEIDLKELFFVLLDKAVVIILAGLCLALGAFLFTKVFMTPVYQSTAQLYVINKQQEGVTTNNDLSAAKMLTQDFVHLVKSRPVLEQVIEELDLNMTSEDLAAEVTVNVPTDTRILEIKVTDADPYTAKEIVDSITDIAAKQIVQIMEMDKVNVVEEGNLPINPVSPSTSKNTLLGGIAGVFIAAILVIAAHLMNDTIRTEEDVERYLGLSVLAAIPIDKDQETKKKKKRRKAKKTK